MNISASRGVYLPRPEKASAAGGSSVQNFNSTVSARASGPARPQISSPVSIEGAGQREQNVVSAYTEIRTQQIRGYMPERLPWSPSVREGLAEYKDIGGQGRRDELEALGVDIFV